MMSHRAELVPVLAALAFILSSGSVIAEEEDHGPYQMEDVEGTDLKRIELIEQAMTRIGIKTAPASLAKADRVFVVGGRIVLNAGAATKVAAAEGESATRPVWVSFPITDEIEDSLGMSVQVRPLNGAATDSFPALADDDLNEGITAEAGGRLFYRLQGDAAALVADQVVLVEVPYSGNGVDHATVPYAAIIYDERGDEWVYVSAQPGVFQRSEVDVAYIAGDTAFLLQGPEVGALVVTVGASELLGIEHKVGH